MLFTLAIALLSLPQDPAHGFARARRPAEVVADGPYTVEPSDTIDDSVPLPVARVIESGEHGDREVAPASGDPFFLGFAAGAHYPPAGERIDPQLSAQLQTAWLDGRPSRSTYAFAMFSKRMTSERLSALEQLGCRVLGFHPHYCVKLALAPELVDQVAALDFVQWIGVPKTWQRVHPALLAAFASAPAGKTVDVWVDVYESDLCPDSKSVPAGTASYGGPEGEFEVGDPRQSPQRWMSNGWQQRALEQIGLDVYEYVEELHAFRARMLPAALELTTALDFVQFVELDPDRHLLHDESMPMVLADRTRITYDAGSSAIAGQVDSGIEYSHSGITGYAWWQNNYTPEPGTDDSCGHGTHVAGTMHGSGNVEDSYEGVANGLGWGATGRFFNVKLFSGISCIAAGTSLSTIMSGLHGAVTDGNGAVTQRPHVVNHSWGSFPAFPGGWIGSEADAREIDAETYTYGQLHVFAAGNEGPGAGTVTQQASAKNALAVGAVQDYWSLSGDPGHFWPSTSNGPCGDGRWKPNLCAPGSAIRSADASTLNGYMNRSGTSMAAPHVTGLAAQLCQHYSALRYNPPMLGALLMATAMTKDNQLLSSPSTVYTNHLNTYGAGRIEALKAHGMADGTSTYFWSWTQAPGSLHAVNVPVLANAKRIAVCLFYTEPASSAGASQALVSDLDLYLDQPPITAGATGEWTVQQSNVNNVEIRILDNPITGFWQLKVDGAAALGTTHVGLAAAVIYDDTTPNGSLTLTPSATSVKLNQDVTITADAYNPEYVASAVFLDSTSSGDWLQSSSTTLEDGADTNLLNNSQFGRDVLLGDIPPNETRSATWVTRWATEGVKTFDVEARSDNWIDKTDSVSITVDGTPPPTPTSLISTTHTSGVWSNDPNIAFSWTQSPDALSGLAGYSWSVTNAFATLPDTVMDIGPVTTFATTLPGTNGVFAFNLRPVDAVGNWQTLLTYTGFYAYDGIAPFAVSGLVCNDHAIGSHACLGVINFHWSTGLDNGGSGVAGYSILLDHGASTDPDTTIDQSTTAWGSAITADALPYYFHVRAIDTAGNVGPSTHAGPYYIVAPSASFYCTGKLNSQGCVPTIGYTGFPSKSVGNFQVKCGNTLNQKNGLLFWGMAPASAPFQGGLLCVQPPTQRTAVQSSGGSSTGNDCTGLYAFAFDGVYMNSYGMDPGETFYAQWWMRDPASPSTTGLSNAIQFTVCE